mmetsp:Transcript_2086/g.9193  ORF Transcript_2086/g.9193 Transcript_2086/m.9193 type:complete len:284 (-) Transcript_2086:302-1153(-)
MERGAPRTRRELPTNGGCHRRRPPGDVPREGWLPSRSGLRDTHGDACQDRKLLQVDAAERDPHDASQRSLSIRDQGSRTWHPTPTRQRAARRTRHLARHPARGCRRKRRGTLALDRARLHASEHGEGMGAGHVRLTSQGVHAGCGDFVAAQGSDVGRGVSHVKTGSDFTCPRTHAERKGGAVPSKVHAANARRDGSGSLAAATRAQRSGEQTRNIHPAQGSDERHSDRRFALLSRGRRFNVAGADELVSRRRRRAGVEPLRHDARGRAALHGTPDASGREAFG